MNASDGRRLFSSIRLGSMIFSSIRTIVSARLAPLFVIPLAVVSAGCATPPEIDFDSSDACFQDVASALSDDTMEGRGIGTAGLRKAANYLNRAYAGLELEPVRSGGVFASYRQRFSAVTGVQAGSDNRLSFIGPEGPEAIPNRDAAFKTEFRPFGFSSSGAFAGEMVFVGYGITATALDYNDYAGLDVRGKVVLAMRYEPGEKDPDSIFDGKRPSRYSDLRYKALKAREAGAAALIFTSPPGDGGEDEDRLPRMVRSGPLSDAGIPVLQIKRSLAKALLASTGQDLAALHAAIETDVKPHSQPLAGLHAKGMVDVMKRRTDLENIVGIIPGRGSLADEAIVVGAHFDHLGYGGSGSLNPDVEQIHNGADDNASGVAAMICGVANIQSRLQQSNLARRALVMVAFGGEESGLLGSAWYVDNAVIPIEQTTAMVNLDMVGRMRDRKLSAMGTDSSSGWRPILDPLATLHEIDVSAGGDGYGPSDHMSFYGKGVPVTHFFTGSHSEYHTAKDDFQLLNTEGGAKITRFLADVLDQLLHEPVRLAYTASENSSTMAGDARGFGAYLGTIPDYSEMMNREGGVLLSGVRETGPAGLAGITGGDRIVSMAGTEIHNLHDMTFVLRDHRPGEVIEIQYLRDEQPHTVLVTLGKRGQQTKPKKGANPHGIEQSSDPHAID